MLSFLAHFSTLPPDYNENLPSRHKYTRHLHITYHKIIKQRELNGKNNNSNVSLIRSTSISLPERQYTGCSDFQKSAYSLQYFLLIFLSRPCDFSAYYCFCLKETLPDFWIFTDSLDFPDSFDFFHRLQI